MNKPIVPLKGYLFTIEDENLEQDYTTDIIIALLIKAKYPDYSIYISVLLLNEQEIELRDYLFFKAIGYDGLYVETEEKRYIFV